MWKEAESRGHKVTHVMAEWNVSKQEYVYVIVHASDCEGCLY